MPGRIGRPAYLRHREKTKNTRCSQPYKAGFTCPKCQFPKTHAIASYGRKKLPAAYRRRECRNCGHRFTTEERLATRESTILVLKRNGWRQPFDRFKLEKSLRIALKNRFVSDERINRVIIGIVSQIDTALDVKQEVTVSSEKIGALALASLKELDQIGYIRYASVFLRFHAKEHFMQIVETLMEAPAELPEQPQVPTA